MTNQLAGQQIHPQPRQRVRLPDPSRRADGPQEPKGVLATRAGPRPARLRGQQPDQARMLCAELPGAKTELLLV